MSNPNPQKSDEDEATDNLLDRIQMEHLIEHTSTPGRNYTTSYPGTSSGSPSTPNVDTHPRFVIRQSPPYVTRFMLAANVLVFVIMVIYGYVNYGLINGTENMSVLVFFGAKVNALVAAGEWWRLFTAMFIHIGVIHLLFNLYALYSLGPLVESYFGHFRFTAIYLVGGLFGSLASYAFSDTPAAGASGAIFGLAGCLTLYFFRYRENFGARGRAILYNMLVVIGINLVFGLSQPGIDNWGHMGGLIGGALVTAGLLPSYRPPTITSYGANVYVMEEEPRLWLNVAWILVCLALWYYGVSWSTQRFLGQF